LPDACCVPIKEDGRMEMDMKSGLGLVVVAAVLLVFAGATLAAEPTQADFDACNQMAKPGASSPSASPQTQAPGRSSAAPPPASPSQDRTRPENQPNPLRGIAEESKDDLAYRQLYRDCMKQRGF
jgi:hypothetical protein